MKVSTNTHRSIPQSELTIVLKYKETRTYVSIWYY